MDIYNPIEPQTEEHVGGFFTKKRSLILIVLALILVIEAIWAFRFLSSQGKNPIENITSIVPKENIARLSIEPQSVTTTVGEQFTVSVSADLAGREINGLDAIIQYDPTYLEVVDSNLETDGIQVENGDMFDSLLYNNVDNQAGIISVTASRISPETPPVSVNGILSVISFQALKQGNTKIEFVFDPTTTSTSNVTEAKTSENILTTVSNADVIVNPQ